MTAMMAFFLVLWIVNSTSKETRSSIARYFNPVRLSDTTPARKGLREPRDSDFDAAAASAGPVPGPTPAPAHPESGKDAHEAAAKADPHAASPDPHAKAAKPGPPASPASTGPVRLTGMPETPAATHAGEGDGEATYRDAFEPLAPRPAAASNPAETAAPRDVAPEAGVLASLDALRAGAARALAAGGFPGGRDAPLVEIKSVPEGVLVSLTDQWAFEMFGSGSVEPNPRAARVVAALAPTLAGQPGRVIVRGHTDSKPFRGSASDNWRLSSARAQAVLQLLLRNGLDAARVDSVAGFADRLPRDPANPSAPENRRIEILLRSAP